MNKLLALLYFALSLFGVDVGGSTFIHRTSTDGIDTLYSKAHVAAGVARFECVRSASGQCHYTVIPRDCAPAPAPASLLAGGCQSGPTRHFAIDDGASRRVPGLQGFGLCVSIDPAPAGTDCQVPEPLAAR